MPRPVLVIPPTHESRDLHGHQDHRREQDDEDKIEYKAISTTQYKDEEKRVKEDNKTKIKEWHDQCKTDPQAPRPKTIYIKKIPKLSGYQTQKEGAGGRRQAESG